MKWKIPHTHFGLSLALLLGGALLFGLCNQKID